MATIDRLAALYVRLVPPPRRPADVERRLFCSGCASASSSPSSSACRSPAGWLSRRPVVFAALHYPDCVAIQDRQVCMVAADQTCEPAIRRILTAAYEAANVGDP